MTTSRFLWSLSILAVQCLAQNSQSYYFYTALPYGTQANYNPLNVIINGGYGILQIPCYDEYGRKIVSFKYREWLADVWLTVGHPINTLNEFGWRRFATTELIPSSIDMNKTQWVPNYFLHTIGAGMHARATEEWYRYHGFSGPRLWSISTMAIYHLLSEVVENKGNIEVNSDHIADLYIFDPLGIWLFTHDGICRFFSEKLHLAEWSMQPAYNLYNGNLENMGQSYVVKYPISKDSVWNLMAHFGLHGTAGISHRWRDGHYLSLTGGFMVENLIRVDQEGAGRALTGVLTWRAGAFYDLNNSLLISLMLSGIAESRLRLNIYPGVWRLGPISPGFFVSGSKEWVVGMSINYVPIGAAWGH